MSLQDVTLKKEYRSLIDNVVQDFYLPLLKEARLYQRAVGFFSSSSLVEISKGIAQMASTGGKIQIVASPHLSEDDVAAIRKGYADRNEIIERALIAQLSDTQADYYSMERLNLLANLIADGVLDIRIAYTEDEKGIGMYHEKMGIITDNDGNRVAFSGSMNESATAMLVNYEAIDVFRDWADSDEKERVMLKVEAFNSLWNDYEPNVHVLEFPNVTDAFIEKYKKKAPSFDVDERQYSSANKTRVNGRHENPIGARVPVSIKFHDYQEQAITAWVGENYRGIFDMATGTGKTYTGLGSIAKLSQDLDDELAVIIVCPYQHLVEQWVEDIKKFNMSPIVGYSSSPQKDWKKRLSDAIRDQKIRADKRFFCFATTNATFASDYVQNQISKIRKPILLVIDEAHNFGAPTYASCLDDRFTYRLALSATLDRYRDDEGTALLYRFFGKKCIEYSLSRAIAEDKLTRYKYHPILVFLNDDERPEYEELSYKMSKCLTRDKNGHLKLNRSGEILAIERSRIVAGAIGKLAALREQMLPYVDDNNILVYCGATSILSEKSDRSETDERDIRQIDAVTHLLGNELGMSVSKFTAEENIETRTLIVDQFQKAGRLQVIVAIKCLDEGVNIPGIRTAFILASTTNPKEYIQRRGRVLRKAPNKAYAEIYDFITLPRPLDSVSALTEDQAKRDLSLVKNELARVKEFGRLSMNPMDAESLIWEIQDAYNIISDEQYEEEDAL